MSLAELCQSCSGTTLPAAFYPSPEMYSGERDKLLASSGATNPFTDVLALCYARCPRLFPTSSRSLPRDFRFLSYPSSWPSFLCVLDIVSSSSTMRSCIRILPWPSIPSTPAPLLRQSSARMCPLPCPPSWSSILRIPAPRYLSAANAPSYPCPCLNLDVPAFLML